MMMKINNKLNRLVALVLLGISTTMNAQDKLFTLEDLNYGGTITAHTSDQGGLEFEFTLKSNR